MVSVEELKLMTMVMSVSMKQKSEPRAFRYFMIIPCRGLFPRQQDSDREFTAVWLRDYCRGGCPGALKKLAEILRLYDP